MYRIEITAVFDSAEEARKALSDCEEAIGKNNGDVDDTTVEEI